MYTQAVSKGLESMAIHFPQVPRKRTHSIENTLLSLELGRARLTKNQITIKYMYTQTVSEGLYFTQQYFTQQYFTQLYFAQPRASAASKNKVPKIAQHRVA
jgi:hypothetical protein